MWSESHQARLAPGVGSYISVPIRRSDGTFVGTLCAIDPDPHRLSPEQAEVLRVLARLYATFLERTEELERRQEAERVLREREERFRALIEHSSDMVAVIDRDGRMVFASPAYLAVLGHRPDDLVGQPFDGLLHPDETDRVRRAMAALLASPGATATGEARMRTADGRWRWVSSVLTNRLDDPAVGGIIVNGRDTTERKEAEGRLLALAAVVEGARLVVFGVDRDRIVTAWNPAAEARLGVPAEVALGRPLPSFAPDGEDDPLPAMLARVLRGERTGYAELRHRAADGEIRQLGVSLAPVRGTDGGIEGASVIGRDVTEFNRLLKDRERLAAQERAVLDAAGEAMALVSPEGLLLVVNRAFAGWFGIDPASATGRPLAEVGPALRLALNEQEEFLEALLAAAADPDRDFVAGVTQHRPQSRELSVTSTPVHDGEGGYLGRLFVLRDVSHEREVERAKSDFVSLVSHELRTPLTSIKGFTDLLLEDPNPALDGDAREFLQIVGANADRLVELVSGLLETSRLEAGRIDLERDTVPLAPLVEQAVASLRPQIDARRQAISLAIDPALPPAWADPAIVTQILTNLLSNANKYTPEGGSITVRVERAGGMLRCAVTDTGIGMDADELGQLFTRFFRARNRTTMATRGTGLGLSITRSLVQLHGGEISVESAPGEGSTFAFTLPIADGAGEAAPSPEPAAAAPSVGEGVLVVEDDPDTARLLRRRLETAGHRVLTAATGADALDLAALERPALILLDLVLPDIDGLDVLERLKADPDLASIPVLILSGVGDDGEGRRLGAVGHLAKPVDEGALLERVAALVQPDEGQILVADDEPEVRRLVATLLRRHGYRVLEAGDGEEAVAIALRERPALALLDIRMPRMTGIEALHALRGHEATRTLPVVMMTAHAAAASEARRDLADSDLGIAALLSKPFTVDDLLATIGRVMPGSSR